MDNKWEQLSQKIRLLNQEQDEMIAILTEQLLKKKEQQSEQIISYFTYSENVLHRDEVEFLLFGSYYIKNLGDHPLTNPHICLKLSKDSPFRLSGKFTQPHSSLQMDNRQLWERVNDQQNRDEYWLKPVQVKQIKPNEVLTFPQFQLNWSQSTNYTASLAGFTYCDEYPDGIPALNQISVSASFGKGGE
ncbi:hypothetical protein [Bacillus sp. 2205SS5-2]|uniref:hypothetical protein n=1 Tax=Bacillus sp. 2205SS5-2 TaxID=3109031 RepID=UPI0030045949